MANGGTITARYTCKKNRYGTEPGQFPWGEGGEGHGRDLAGAVRAVYRVMRGWRKVPAHHSGGPAHYLPLEGYQLTARPPTRPCPVWASR